MAFGLLSIYYVVLFVVLLQCFIFMGAIQIGKTDSISQRYYIIVVSMLNNWCPIYFSHYIKFVGFMMIYYTTNLDIVLSFMVFSNLYIGFIIYYKFESTKLFFIKKKTKRKS